ncbi:MAG: MGDG synthase family glycosyltransferase [Luteolibacter sp.]
MKETPRILIVTAAFGEGHNSAARNMALALDAEGAVCQVSDPILQGAPMTTAIVSRAYRFVTNRLPWVWHQIYKSTDRCDFTKRQLPVLRYPEKAFGRMIDQFKPDAIVSTYPLYPYFLRRIRQGINGSVPMITVVTDSIEINASWLRAPCDHWLVTDAKTRERMDPPVPVDKITATGFPVHPRFASQDTLAEDDACSPFRILYFATTNPHMLSSQGCALLDVSSEVRLTIVMGRNVRKLVRRAKALQQAYPGRVRLIGWTRRVPKLLAHHHLVVGKAGGATVHEAIAARCPMLIHHLVPGQEEGNLQLLESIGGGALANAPRLLKGKVTGLLANDAGGWREMKRGLIRHNRSDGSQVAARFVLDYIKATQ